MKKKKLSVKQMAYLSLFLALHIVLQLCFSIIPNQPQGGNVSLDLLPIILAGYLMGPIYGVVLGIICTFTQFILGLASFYGPWSVVLDYLVPITIVGLSSFFKNFKIKNITIYTGIIVTMIIKFLSHFASGVWLFGEYVPVGMNPYVYSFGYNIVYCLPTCIICYIGFRIIYPRIEKIFR